MVIETTTEESSGSGIIVPQSDYQAAIRAIEETFQKEELRRRAKAAEDGVVIGERGELSWQQPDDEDDILAANFCTSVKESLIQSLSRIVQPTQNDQEYHDIIDPYHIVEDEEDEEDEENEGGGGDKTTTEEVNDDDEDKESEEYSESDLLDIQAWQEAQKLRSRVRELSHRVQQIRERTLNRTRETLPSSSEDAVSGCVVEVEESKDISSLRNEEFDASVKRLMELVHHPKWSKMVDETKKLQDTINVVQNEQDRPLSQIDAAIVSRTNSASDEDDAKLRNDLHVFLSQQETEDDESEEVVMLSPNDRLAAFFQQLQ